MLQLPLRTAETCVKEACTLGDIIMFASELGSRFYFKEVFLWISASRVVGDVVMVFHLITDSNFPIFGGLFRLCLAYECHSGDDLMRMLSESNVLI